MRHNTKVVIASNRSDEEGASTSGESSTDPRTVRSPAPSPRKASQQTWTTVPWNGQPRRPSMRMSGGIPKKKPVAGPVPPLPGQSSNVQESIAPIEENEPTLDGALDDGEERGRLFVKVVGMKYLDLPLPKGEYFIHLSSNHPPPLSARQTDANCRTRRAIVLCSYAGQWPSLCHHCLAGTRENRSDRTRIRAHCTK